MICRFSFQAFGCEQDQTVDDQETGAIAREPKRVAQLLSPNAKPDDDKLGFMSRNRDDQPKAVRRFSATASAWPAPKAGLRKSKPIRQK